MSTTVLIDYGCHSFTHRLASHLSGIGVPIRYFVNGSLESPNLTSLAAWARARPYLLRSITCKRPYGKLSLHRRLLGELEWARHCTEALEEENPSVVFICCVPLSVATRIQKWTERHGIPLVYWLQDLQGRAIHDLLGRKLGLLGRVLGSFAYLWEQHIIEKSRMVITIAEGHERELPFAVRQEGRYALLENWANIEEFPQFSVDNDWSVHNGLDKTLNVVYSGTLGLKHDLTTFIALALHFADYPDVRVVVVSSGHASDTLRMQAAAQGLRNLIVLPFQPYEDVPKVLASAAVLVAPLEASAGGFCVPSKVLSYLCAGRPTVIAIDANNPAAATIQRVGAGTVVQPGDAKGFVNAVVGFLNDEGSRELAGRRARVYAEQTFGLDQVTQKFLAIFSRTNSSFQSPFSLQNVVVIKSAAAGQ
jgi:colanic acid biosynthesis glycosyl transferase WcaI